MRETILEARGLWRSYSGAEEPVAALRGVDLTIRRGEFAAIMGPSGCGKSTLLQLCGAMDRADGGTLSLLGREVAGLSDAGITGLRRRHVGFVFQFFNLLPTLTVAENIALPLLLAGEREAKSLGRAREIAERVGIAHRLTHFPAQISGGEAQRAALARAVVHQPDLIIADEPTGSLDSVNGRRVLDLFAHLHRDLGVAILLATHDESVAAAAERTLRMHDGRIVE